MSAVRTLVQDFGWIHTGIGMLGNTAFFLGSIAFLPDLGKWGAVGTEWKTVGVWLFIFGTFLMLVGAIGHFLVQVYEAREGR